MGRSFRIIICLLIVIFFTTSCQVKQAAVEPSSTGASTPAPEIEYSISDAISRYIADKEKAYPRIDKIIHLSSSAVNMLDTEAWSLCKTDDIDMTKPIEILAECEKNHGKIDGKDTDGNPYAAEITPGDIYSFELIYSDEGDWMISGEYDPNDDSLNCQFTLDGETMRVLEFSKISENGYAGQIYSRFDGDTFYCTRSWSDGKDNGDVGFSAQEYSEEPESIFQNKNVPLSFVCNGVPFAYYESSVFSMQAEDNPPLVINYSEEPIVAGNFAGAQYDNHTSTANGPLATDLSLPLTHLIPEIYFNNQKVDDTAYYFYQPRKKPRYMFVSIKALDGKLYYEKDGDLLPVDINRSGKTITFSCSKGDSKVLELSMSTNSTKLKTSSGEIDMGISPSSRKSTVFIPIYALLNEIGGGVSMNPAGQNIYHIYSGNAIKEGPINGVWSNRKDFTSEIDLREGNYKLDKNEKLFVWQFSDIQNAKLISVSYKSDINKWEMDITQGMAELHGRIFAAQWQLCSKFHSDDLASGKWDIVYTSLPPAEANPQVTENSSMYMSSWSSNEFSYINGMKFYLIGTVDANTKQ